MKKINVVKCIEAVLVISILLITFSCKEKPESASGGNGVEFGNTTADSVSCFSITVSTTLLSTGGNTITQHGHYYGTAPNPEITGGNNTSLGQLINAGKFTSQLTNLTENTKYYIQPYISLSGNTIYPAHFEISTLPLTFPTVTTSDVFNISSTFAACGGNVTSDGNGIVSARGVCWNTTGNPTLANSIGHSTDGTGTGTFTSNIAGLNIGTNYFVTAYSTNNKGTSYGIDVKQFTTLASNALCGDSLFYGGQYYHIVKIGTQCWFKENLNIGTQININQRQEPYNATIEKYCYLNNPNLCDTYGGLYDWLEMMQNSKTPIVQGICPDGWHIPSDKEWSTLADFLSSGEGNKMKEKGTSHWSHPNYGNNSSGFTALPGGKGEHLKFSFRFLTYHAYFWSSTFTAPEFVKCRQLTNRSQFLHPIDGTDEAFSVRCLKD